MPVVLQASLARAIVPNRWRAWSVRLLRRRFALLLKIYRKLVQPRQWQWLWWARCLLERARQQASARRRHRWRLRREAEDNEPIQIVRQAVIYVQLPRRAG